MQDLMALLWEPAVPPRRGPRPALTLEAIAGAGIEAADADGLSAVTMQRLAERLGVTKMALYRYVPGKAELVALMLDAAIGAPPFPPPGASWRAALDAWARALYARFCHHPWALEAAVGARVVGPRELTWLERAVAAMDGTGLDGGEILDVAVILTGHVRNLAQQVTAMSAASGTEGPSAGEGSAESGGAEGAMESALRLVLAGRQDRFPALTAALTSAATAAGRDQALDFGLDRILDGVAALIDSRGPAAGPDGRP
ncbi:TetR/AcrR family transcriptional regulator [Actinoplanes sp. NEAU-A12]|uniref:TetR/AcrR family transcriptional regulator n=1 Tax=Actinoplanes sandaracinus TaxID=3045177 RepID=A0ABT6WGT8_9ACTN|nr:TetR/AcrR family transcriptional regulator [Actinoplanes sandaracinus]MDI6098946.1 TetR/AcrR family transcriptional regulator [Actinoplanes sandaracinus]